jgi:hypothetical protein
MAMIKYLLGIATDLFSAVELFFDQSIARLVRTLAANDCWNVRSANAFESELKPFR